MRYFTTARWPFPAASTRGGSPQWSDSFRGAPSATCSLTQSICPSTQSRQMLVFSGTNRPDTRSNGIAGSARLGSARLGSARLCSALLGSALLRAKLRHLASMPILFHYARELGAVCVSYEMALELPATA